MNRPFFPGLLPVATQDDNDPSDVRSGLASHSDSFTSGARAMRPRPHFRRAAVAGLVLMTAVSSAFAFNSGSTGADGALAPTVDTIVDLPPSGILNYSSINIPANVTVRFRRNTANTPVVLLVSGNATISGTLDVSGSNAAASGTAGDGVLADDGNPGIGGPGGFDGGRGGRPGALDSTDRLGGKGLGPGGGGGGLRHLCSGNDYDQNLIGYYGGGGGASYGTAGSAGARPTSECLGSRPGATYGSVELLPLIGGSGGGGGVAGTTWYGSGGGGGGGALLIAVTGTLTITSNTGRIFANGGSGGQASAAGCSGSTDYQAAGGGGSGGAIRLIATTIAGNGQISANNGGGGGGTCGFGNGGSGGDGRIRLEAETITRTAGSNPQHSFAQPGPVFIAGAPSLAITSVGGVNVPQPPTGVADVRLPAATTNPVTVAFTTTGIPVGNTVKLSVVPASGAEVTAVSTALAGSTASATATASIDLPAGASTLQATITYTVVAELGDALSRFAQGERVERIAVSASLDGPSRARLITASGREFDAPAEALRIAALGR